MRKYFKRNRWIVNAIINNPLHDGKLRIATENVDVTVRKKDIGSIEKFADYVSSIPNGNEDAINLIQSICSYIKDHNLRVVDNAMYEAINCINNTSVNIHMGQKISRLVGMIGKAYGFSVDCGWSYHFAIFCDVYYEDIAKKTVYVSANPDDFRDFMENWANHRYLLPSVAIYTTDDNGHKSSVMFLTLSKEGALHKDVLRPYIYDENVVDAIFRIVRDIKGGE